MPGIDYEIEQPEEYFVIEKKAKDGGVVEQKESSDGFDFSVSEAAVGSVGGVVFTVAGIMTEERNGETIYKTYLDIDKSRFVNIEKGTIVDIKDGLQIEVVDILHAEEPKKGKVLFRKL